MGRAPAPPTPSNTSLTHPYVNVDGVWNQYGGYQPDVLATFATDFITQTPTDQPFFVMYSPTSPHLPADDPRYDDMPVSPPRGGAFNANMMTEGAPRFARRSALNADEIANSDANYVSMAHATRSLDDAMGAVLESLGDRSRDTLVIFMSDNGFLYGEHRRVGKNDQWEESVNVPMVVRYPAVLSADQSFVSDDLVQNVDIGATIADLVGFPWKADGRSFVPILEHRKGHAHGRPHRALFGTLAGHVGLLRSEVRRRAGRDPGVPWDRDAALQVRGVRRRVDPAVGSDRRTRTSCTTWRAIARTRTSSSSSPTGCAR